MPDHRPNVLLLFTDQQRFDTIAAAGWPHMVTPNLDRLLAGGCHYPQAHTPNPVCMAARHYLLTGLPGRHHGYFANRHGGIADYRLPTLPRLLSEAGYVTGAIGKMHFDPPRMHHGYDELHLMEELPRYREEDAYLLWLEQQGYGHLRHPHGCRHLLYHTPQRALVPARLHGSSFVASRSIEFIDRHRDRPWFAMASWVGPHPPWNIPADWRGRYAGRELPAPWPLARDFPFESQPCPWHGDFDEPARRRAVQEAYFSAISLIDDQIGRLLDHLDSSGLASNTLVIFSSDHGEMLYDRGYFQKQVPYESSVRVPLLMRFPERVAPGSVRPEFADLLDLAPTIWDAAGVALPDGPYPGESLLRPAVRRDRSVQYADFGVGQGRWAMLRDERFKLVHYWNGGFEELYDTVADPGEQHNLLRHGGAPAGVADRLRARLLAAEATRGPLDSLCDGNFADRPAQVIGPPGSGKYPLWAHQQFPTWGPLAPELEAGLLRDEILAAVDGCFDDLLADPRWEAAWRQGWAACGGDEAFGDRIFGRPARPPD
ncbi:MAG: sulfatase-like hydrolase/transferase [Fimbriimonadaceae bacterium]|nr:sulfatase-like hydrolase/transferase [Fimbriimonadaceae bacterium]